MNIVHLIDYVHPDAGYEVNVLARLQAKAGNRVTIVTGEPDKAPAYLTDFFGTDEMPMKDARFRNETGVTIVRLPVIGFYSARALFYPSIFKTIRKLNPDVVFVHCQDGLNGIIFTWLAPFLGYPIVLDCHSLEMGSVNRFRGAFRFFYKNLVAPFIRINNIPVIRLVDSDFVEKCLGVPLRSTVLLSFGTDTDLFYPDGATRAEFRVQLGISDAAFVVVYAGKIDVHKGGKFLAEAVREKLSSTCGKEIVFLIVGSASGDYGQAVEADLSATKNRIIRIPTQRYMDLPKIYQAADMAFFPKQCSLSFFDVQSCELPVLFEDNEINRERGNYGNTVIFTSGDVADFRRKLQAMVDMPEEDFAEMKRRARKYVTDHYDFVPMARKFTEVMAKARDRYLARHKSADSNP